MASVSLKLFPPRLVTCWSGFGVARGPLLLGLWGWAKEKKGVKDGLLGSGQSERSPREKEERKEKKKKRTYGGGVPLSSPHPSSS